MLSKHYMVYATIVSAVIFLTVSLAGAAVVPRMTTDELKSRLGDEGLTVLDVRASGDWAGSNVKIIGAERIDQRALGQWVESHAKGQTIVLYCA